MRRPVAVLCARVLLLLGGRRAMGAVSHRSWRCSAAVIIVFFSAAVAVAAAGRPARVSAAVLQHMRRTGSSALLIRSSTSSTDDGNAAADPRRRLVGPGSSPPTCRSRCGRCTPCRAVRVAIQPGIGTQWEYYPEVWRCKCGSKLYMP